LRIGCASVPFILDGTFEGVCIMQVRTSVSLVIALACLAASGPDSLAATRYVSPSGSNTPPYDTWENASHTIQAAIGSSSTGDTVLVGASTYSPNSGEQFPIQLDGSVDGIQIAGGSGVSKVIVDAKGTGTVFQLNSCNTTLKSLTLTGGSGAGITASGGSISVVGCWILNNQGAGVVSWFGSAINLASSVVSGNGIGVSCVDQGSLGIKNCAVSGNLGVGPRLLRGIRGDTPGPMTRGRAGDNGGSQLTKSPENPERFRTRGNAT